MNRSPRRVLLFGWPVEHSLSPVLQRAAFEALGLTDWSYEAVGVRPKELAERFEEARHAGMLGCNFTIPHKRAALELVDEIEADAVAIGAINSAARDGAKLVGFNTDVAGFVGSVSEAELDLIDERVVVLGAGGAARAAVAGAIQCGARAIGVAARKLEASEELCEALRKYASQIGSWVSIEPIPLRDRVEAADAIRGARLLINGTPLGMDLDDATPVPLEWLDEVGGVFDCIYRADGSSTPLIEAARELGRTAIDGTGMLLHQGAAAFERWTGQEAPREAMRSALNGALGRR
ncbi:MAG: shikimate dehydrogenase [Planctomycetes bacterium]|nr:shikimate dehydrogenase [Planctomycetota bacterium]